MSDFSNIDKKHAGGRPLKYKNVGEMQVIIDKYIAENNDIDNPPTMSGLACALGIDRSNLINYAQKDEYYPAIKQARQHIEKYMEKLLLTKKTSPIGVIFALKNNFTWRDDKQVSVRHFGINDVLKADNPIIDGELVDDPPLLE